jgi:hypothetical protein
MVETNSSAMQAAMTICTATTNDETTIDFNRFDLAAFISRLQFP